MNNCIICTQNLTRDFRNVRTPGGSNNTGTIRAVDHMTLEVPRGIVFGFLGPNGSGKTTTIRLLLGLLEPSEGRAEVFGFDTVKQAGEIRERTGALLEHTGLYERLSAEDNLEFFGRIARLSASERAGRIQELLAHLGLWDRRKEIIGAWSRGMKQKLAIARALMNNPQLIFLDEPTSGLDPVAAAALREDLASLASDGKVTIFLTTHNLAEAEKLCEQVAVIRAGKLLAIGSPEALRSQHGTTQTEIYGSGFTPDLLALLRARPEITGLKQVNNHLVLDLQPDVQTGDIVRQMVVNGAQIDEVRKNKASLEDIFLELVDEEPKEA
jgi:ABC-2 type transport system ATP-binding protein